MHLVSTCEFSNYVHVLHSAAVEFNSVTSLLLHHVMAIPKCKLLGASGFNETVQIILTQCMRPSDICEE
jgi:hypothetical protein